MIMQIGAALLMIWLMNWLYVLYKILRYSPNWRDEETAADEIVQNFVTDADIDEIEQIKNIVDATPYFGWAGLLLWR